MAEKILYFANKYHIPVIEDESLVKGLSVLEEGDQIPLILYKAVAILLYNIKKLL